MKTVIPALVVGVAVFALQRAHSSAPEPAKLQTPEEVAAATYEHLATAIIAIEATEDSLVKTILTGHHVKARYFLSLAIGNEEKRQDHLEAAATQITNIANEGDKQIQAVRQRLKKAGHTHNTDETTKEDYMFVDSKEKKQLLDLGRKVARMGANASADEIRGVQDDLTNLFSKVVAAE
jgi:hypothetical protein